MNPPWEPSALFERAGYEVHGPRAHGDVMAVSAAYHQIDMGENDHMIVYGGLPEDITAFQPVVYHKHTQDCNRA